MFAYCYNRPVCMADFNGEDAIYVLVLSKEAEGLPVVGHARLYIQDADGNWYRTEYTGPSKSDAEVMLEYRTEEAMLEEINTRGVKVNYISGDFSASYELAKQYNGTDYGGYSLFRNNCLHYAKEILQAGATDSFTSMCSLVFPTNVPTLFFTIFKLQPQLI